MMINPDPDTAAAEFKNFFGPQTVTLNTAIIELRKTIPSTTAEMQSAFTTFGALACQFGYTRAEAAVFAVTHIKLAGDLASFHNLKISDAFLKISAAITGEFAPLKSLGIVIDQARLKKEAPSTLNKTTTSQFTPRETALLVYCILIYDMGDALGDARAAKNSLQTKIKFISAALKETLTKWTKTKEHLRRQKQLL